MMRTGCLLLILGLSSTGCVSPAPNIAAESRQYPPVQMRVAPPAPVVTADQVNESNAADVAQALSQEMDSETASQSRATPMVTTMANPMKP